MPIGLAQFPLSDAWTTTQNLAGKGRFATSARTFLKSESVSCLRDIPLWLRAQTLGERKAALAQLASSPEIDLALAKARYSEWRAIPGLADEQVWRRRLALDGFSEAEFFAILGATPEALFGVDHVPAWLERIGRCEVEGVAPRFVSRQYTHYADRGLLAPFLALICWHANALFDFLTEQRALTRSLGLDANNVLDLLLGPALMRMEYYFRGPAILEVNILRLCGCLEGETAEARFQTFRNRLRDADERWAVMRNYPVAARALTRALELWGEASREFLLRLEGDLDLLRDKFMLPKNDVFVGIDPGAGDVHCHGRSVARVEFASGKKIVYKPRVFAMDDAHRAFFEWCSSEGLASVPRTFERLNRGIYSWVEFIEQRPAANEEEYREFYYRLGVSIALLHVLSAVDIHFENLIACGPDPVAIDLETLFHVNLDEPKVGTASAAALADLRDSVMAIGILPTPVRSGQGDGIFDMSAIGASVNQQAPYKVLGLANFGRDDINVSHIPGWIPSVHNRPDEDARRPVPGDRILEGFETAYRFLLVRRANLLSPEGPLACFASLRGRLIARNTRYYGSLFMEAAHTDFLHDEVDRALHFEQIWSDIPARPIIENFIASEQAQLAEGDIPFFTTALNNCNAVVGANGAPIAGVQFEPGFARAVRTIERMSEEDLRDQLWLIRGSLGETRGFDLRPLADTPSASFLDHATSIGRAVVTRLRRFGDTASSLTVNCIFGGHAMASDSYVIATSGADLYEGNGGIAFFLAYLGRQTGDPLFTNMGRALIRDVLNIMHSRLGPWNNISGLIGAPSLIYVLAHLGKLWSDTDLLDEARKLTRTVLDITLDENSLDLLLGAAGCLLAVLPMAESGEETAFALARRCGEYLVGVNGDGIARWRATRFKRGFSHGLAGMAYAFSELDRLAGGFAEPALAALEAEDELLGGGQWTDEHMYGGAPQVSWCHGAVGIALSRLGIYRNTGSRRARDGAERALKQVELGYWMDSHCLCHGCMGNLEPLLVASRLSGFACEADSVRAKADRITADIRARGWRSLLPSQTLGLGLFTGLSGLGYGYLRLCDPESTPSVMMLAGPPPPSSKARA